MLRRHLTIVAAVAALLAPACGGGSKPPADPSAGASGMCEGVARQPLDCASEVAYQGTDLQGQVSVLGLGSAAVGAVHKALQQIDQQTATYIAEARRLCDEYNKCVVDKDTYATRSENMRRRIAKVPELAEGLKGASSDDARRALFARAYRDIVPDGDRTELGLKLSVLAQGPSDPAMSPLTDGASIHTGSHVAFVVQVTRAAYVYLFQRSSSGSVAVLYPDPRIPIPNPIPPTTPLRIPQGGASFKLDDNDIGTEGVFIVASLLPVTQLATAADHARAGGASNAALTQLTSIDSGCKSRGLSYAEDDPAPAGCVRSRGLSYDDGGGGGGGDRASVSQTTEAGDDLIATVFHFQHAH